MNFRNRKLAVTVRILLGLFILFSGVSGFMAGSEMKNIPAPMVPTMTHLWNMGIFQMIKTTEIVAGLMLIVGFLPALALLFLAPICVGVIVFDLNVAPEYLASGIVVNVLTAYLGYVYWDKYKAIFANKKLNS
ncbi:MAG TPA: hypothetical protein PK295_01310 [Candidatus Magasanikbacteria bacterium]|nr:hypothetical protein [Candidatus Magasanikbacteria bacterium]